MLCNVLACVGMFWNVLEMFGNVWKCVKSKSFALLEPEVARFDLFEDSQQPYNAGAWGARRDVRRRIAWRAPKTRLRRSSAWFWVPFVQEHTESSQQVPENLKFPGPFCCWILKK